MRLGMAFAKYDPVADHADQNPQNTEDRQHAKDQVICLLGVEIVDDGSKEHVSKERGAIPDEGGNGHCGGRDL